MEKTTQNSGGKRRRPFRPAVIAAVIVLLFPSVTGCGELDMLQVIRERVEEAGNPDGTDSTDETDDTTETDDTDITGPAAVTGVALESATLLLGKGDTAQLTATVEPVDAGNPTVSWSSSDTTVAAVDTDGLVTAAGIGTATITVTTTDGEFTAQCSVTVKTWSKTVSGSVTEPLSSITYTDQEADLSFALMACPGGTFPRGTDDSGSGTVAPLWVGQAETTYALVAYVFQWAYDNGKMADGTVDGDLNVTLHGQPILDFTQAGRIDFSDGIFSIDFPYEESYPCGEITWYGAVLFCNWLTEIVDGNADEVVYSNIDSDWDHRETIIDKDKTGFRLLEWDEWECAARYIGTTPPSTGKALDTEAVETDVDGTTYYWTPGEYASGAAEAVDQDNPEETNKVAWSDSSDGSGLRRVGTAGSTDGSIPLSGNPNQLGIFDLSGNSREWSWTRNGDGRYLLGGQGDQDILWIRVGYNALNGTPHHDAYYVGFRFGRNR
jgi:hypothetical protein